MTTFEKISKYIAIGLVSALVGGIVGYKLNKPIHANPAIDLNGDGVIDMIIDNSFRHRTPLFGVKDIDGLDYISGSKMEKIMREKYPKREFDYAHIENVINE